MVRLTQIIVIEAWLMSMHLSASARAEASFSVNPQVPDHSGPSMFIGSRFAPTMAGTHLDPSTVNMLDGSPEAENCLWRISIPRPSEIIYPGVPFGDYRHPQTYRHHRTKDLKKPPSSFVLFRAVLTKWAPEQTWWGGKYTGKDLTTGDDRNMTLFSTYF